MSLEEYFDFLSPEDVRIKGTRVGIESVVYAFQDGLSPEEIVQEYPSLSLEQVYATIAYYLHSRSEVDDYIARLEKWAEERRRERERDVPPVIQRLRALRAHIRQAQVSV
jgi:uncharacterized protein (DUF433 family)